MCYPKPGPRCSSYAALKLAEVSSAAEKAAQNGHGFNTYQELRDKVQQAQLVLDSTPLGMKILEEQMKFKKSLGYQQCVERLRVGKQTRARQMREFRKSVNPEAVTHESQTEVPRNSLIETSFADSATPRPELDQYELSNELRHRSSEWLHGMSNSEVANMRWMTDYGASIVNHHLGGDTSIMHAGKKVSPEEIQKRMKVIDRALKKFRSPEPVISYRGLRESSLPEALQYTYNRSNPDEKSEAAIKDFPVGGTYTSEYYMPTSFQPFVAARFADYKTILEIRSRKAAPVSPVSITQNEQEGLIGRGEKFRIVGVQRNVIYPGNRTVTVIQLEDLD